MSGARIGTTIGIVVFLIVGATALVWLHSAGRGPRALHLTDGTEVFFRGDTRIVAAETDPRSREVRVNGDAFFRTPEAPTSLVVRTRLLVLTITGASAFRVTAYTKQSGEQVDVLYGRVEASKAYPSVHRDPEILSGGEFTMINDSVDLMEKERFDPAELRRWSEELMASAGGHR